MTPAADPRSRAGGALATVLVALAVTVLGLAGPARAAVPAPPVLDGPVPVGLVADRLDPNGGGGGVGVGVDNGGALRLRLDELTPRMVTGDGPDTLTVTGSLTNAGDTVMRDLVVRVQRGDALRTEGELRDAIDGVGDTDSVAPAFSTLAAELAPGQTAPVRVTVPLRGPPATSLALTTAGVYDVLVNVNGAPVDGDRARLAAARLLLPVLALPGDQAPPEVDEPGPGTPFSMLYPITDVPRRLSTLPGEVLLTDDELAASLARGGRLDGLLAAVEREAPAGSPLREALCLAVDPDLAQTVEAMRGGYQARGRDGAAAPGRGSVAADQWLARLAALTRDGCVVALPYADADLVALTRGGLGDAAATAVADGRQVLADVLGTAGVPDLTWPADGVADAPTLTATATAGTRTLLLSADGLEPDRSRPAAGVVPIAAAAQVTGAAQVAVLTDPLLALATGGGAADLPDAGAGTAAPAGSVAGTVSPLGTQDAVGTLAFRAGNTAVPDGAPLVLAPPHEWTADVTGARALLAAAGALLDAERLVPRDLTEVVAVGAPPGTPPRAPVYPLAAGGREIPVPLIEVVAGTSADLVDLRSALVDGSGLGIGPDDALAPYRQGLVRAASVAGRQRPDVARAVADAGAAQVRDLRAAVRVLEPPGPYSLGSSTAPLPLTVVNGLPVTVRVGIEVSSPSGLRVAPAGELEIPPLGRRQVSVTTEVTRAGQFTVDASVRTPDGGLLGPPSRLRVRSTVYGTITVWLTAGAGVMLVVLAVRRVLRRVRGEPGRGVRRPVPSGGPLPAVEDLAPTEQIPAAVRRRQVHPQFRRPQVPGSPGPVPGPARRPPDPSGTPRVPTR